MNITVEGNNDVIKMMRIVIREESIHSVLQTTNTALYALHRGSHYILIPTQYSKDGYQPHCRDEETEAHRNQRLRRRAEF